MLRSTLMAKIIVASTNPVKIDTTKQGFAQMFPHLSLQVDGISAPSNVSNQPLSERETLTGARNRAKNASKLAPHADYWVGIEDGLKQTKKTFVCLRLGSHPLPRWKSWSGAHRFLYPTSKSCSAYPTRPLIGRRRRYCFWS